MRILFAVNSIGAQGGMERVTIVKANAFASREGIEVGICFNDRGSYPKTMQPLNSNIKVYDLEVPFWGMVGLKRTITQFPRKVWQTIKAMKRVINEFQPDVVITTGSYERFALALLPPPYHSRKLLKIREFHFASDYRWYAANGKTERISAKIMEWFERQIMSRFFTKSYVLTPSDLKRNFNGINRFDYMMNPLTLPPLDVDFGKKDKTVIAVGRIVYEKNFESLIRVWAHVEPIIKEWKLRILGGPDNAAQKLLDYAQSLGCKRVECPGWCNDVNSELEKASIICITSRSEGYSLALIEGMNAGAVPISYDLPYGPADLIENGKNGILVPYLDEKSFADALLNVINDQSKRKEMAIKSNEFAKQLSLEKIIDGWIEKYRMLLNES